MNGIDKQAWVEMMFKDKVDAGPLRGLPQFINGHGLNANASEFARVCRTEMQNAGIRPLTHDMFASGKTLIKTTKGLFKKNGRLSSAGEKLLREKVSREAGVLYNTFAPFTGIVRYLNDNGKTWTDILKSFSKVR